MSFSRKRVSLFYWRRGYRTATIEGRVCDLGWVGG